MVKTKTTAKDRRPVSWKVRQDVRRALKVAVAQDATTCEEYGDRLLVEALSRRGLLSQDAARPTPAA